MPELPEVEAARRAIEEHCIGKRIVKAIIADDSKVIDGGVSSAYFEASITGKSIVGAHRKGKNMWLKLDSPPFPSFQFGMAGAIYIKGVAVTKYKRAAVSDTDEWPSKYSKFFVELDDGLELSFTDKRRFAKVRLLNNPASVPPISELGPDALLEPMTMDELASALSKKKIGIKALLLDQSFVSGIGNWIADEVLYQARIHPLQAASSLSKENCADLHKSIKEVIEKAVEVGADTNQFPSDWIFHSREKKPGKAFVDGKKIEFIAAGGRTTAYVPELQKLSGSQASKTQIKPRKKAAKASKDESAEDPDSDESEEEDKKGKKAKPKGKGKKITTSARKAPPSRKKKDDDDEDGGEESDDDEDYEKEKKTKAKEKKSTTAGKAPPTKKKNVLSNTNKNDDDDEDGVGEGSDEDEYDAPKKKAKTAKKPSQVNGKSKNTTRRK